MTIRHLKVFICVCKHESMSKAAEELFIAQPAVSKTISEIEQKYNVVLFERINKRLHLTEEGKKLLIKAKEVISAFESFEDEANSSSISPLVKIGASLTIGKQQIPSLIRKLKDKFNNVDFQISINQTSIIENKILNWNLDFAFIQGMPSNVNIASRFVGKSNLVATCGADYNIPEKLTLKELCKYDLLLREDDGVSREFIDQVFARENIVVNPMIESVSNHALISAAVNNLGVALLPEPLIKSRLKSGKLKSVTITDHEFIRSSYLIYHKGKTFSDIKKTIIEFSLQNFKKVGV